MYKYDIAVYHDHGLDLNNDYVVISSSFKLSKKIRKILGEVVPHLNLIPK